jgi:hydroxyacylglutathione hydrolase
MKKSFLLIFVFAVLATVPAEQVLSNGIVLLREVTGPIETNCYLLYDEQSKEAALFDVGGPIDTLISVLTNRQLKLKYIFATHCHMDHMEGIPMIIDKFPDVLLAYNKEDYADFLVFKEAMKNNTDKKEFQEMMQDSIIAKWFSYDLSIFRAPDLYLDEGQVYLLGNSEIRTFLSPGHSRGSICFYVDNILLSGDVLFYRNVGRTDLPGVGSTDNLVKSVRRLYTDLSEETSVYPGHGQSTDIGSEKRENKKITLENVFMK